MCQNITNQKANYYFSWSHSEVSFLKSFSLNSLVYFQTTQTHHSCSARHRNHALYLSCKNTNRWQGIRSNMHRKVLLASFTITAETQGNREESSKEWKRNIKLPQNCLILFAYESYVTTPKMLGELPAVRCQARVLQRYLLSDCRSSTNTEHPSVAWG